MSLPQNARYSPDAWVMPDVYALNPIRRTPVPVGTAVRVVEPDTHSAQFVSIGDVVVIGVARDQNTVYRAVTVSGGVFMLEDYEFDLVDNDPDEHDDQAVVHG